MEPQPPTKPDASHEALWAIITYPPEVQCLELERMLGKVDEREERR